MAKFLFLVMLIASSQAFAQPNHNRFMCEMWVATINTDCQPYVFQAVNIPPIYDYGFIIEEENLQRDEGILNLSDVEGWLNKQICGGFAPCHAACVRFGQMFENLGDDFYRASVVKKQVNQLCLEEISPPPS